MHFTNLREPASQLDGRTQFSSPANTMQTSVTAIVSFFLKDNHAVPAQSLLE